MCSFFLGVVSYEIQVRESNSHAVLFESQLKKNTPVKVQIIANPDIRIDRTLYTVQPEGKKILLLMTARIYPEYEYGDTIEIRGKIQRPKDFDGFSYTQYLKKDGIFFVSYYPSINLIQKNKGTSFFTFLNRWERAVKEKISKNLHEPYAGILNAMILDERGYLSEETKQNFQNSGIIHIIAISGLNIAIIIYILSKTIQCIFISQKVQFVCVVIIIVMYLALIGFPSSANRAAFMILLIFFCRVIGRKPSSIHILMIAAGVMVFHNPQILLHDVSFQLSVVAVFGILVFYPSFLKIIEKKISWKFFSQSISVTCAASITTFPFIVYYFKNFSLVFLPTNILVVFTLPFVTFAGFAGIVCSFFVPSIAKIIFFTVWVVLDYILKVSSFFSHLPYSTFHFSNSNILIIFFWFIILYPFYLSIKKYADEEII